MVDNNFKKDTFIRKSIEKHGTKYSYDNVEYINVKAKVSIVCPIHGEFQQSPEVHLRSKHGCPRCAEISESNIDTFLKKAQLVHSNKYDYTSSVYTHSTTPLTIICSDHGEFLQTPKSHISGHGCPRCAGKAIMQKDEFLIKANRVHGSKYKYDFVTINDSRTPVDIICPTHGKFAQLISSHLRGSGCSKCSNNYNYTFSEVVTKAKELHKGSGYTYKEDGLYKNIESNLTITCPVHGDFVQKAKCHLQEKGCPQCAKTGFDKSKSAILYYLKINGGQAYKIGITNRTVEERFSSRDLNQIEVLATKYYEVGQDAYADEQQVLKDYKEFKYNGPDILASGNTELFSSDILNLDTRLILLNY